MNIQYIANQTGVLFFRLGFYEKWDGKEQSANTHETIKKLQKKLKEEKRVPKTWIKKINDAHSIVEAAYSCNVITQEWYESYFQLLEHFGEKPLRMQ